MMFPTNVNTHQILHDARQRELEVAAAVYRQAKNIDGKHSISPFRQKIGMLLIEWDKK